MTDETFCGQRIVTENVWFDSAKNGFYDNKANTANLAYLELMFVYFNARTL